MAILSVKFHDCLEKVNVLAAPSKSIANFLDTHPALYKIVLIICHLFRAAMVVGLMFIPYLPLYAKMAICFAGSLFYRLTVERNCAYKFALPAFFGGAAFMLALPALISLISQTAFLSTGAGFAAISSLLPLTFYAIYILLTVNYDVNKNLEHLILRPNRSEQKKCECDSIEV